MGSVGIITPTVLFWVNKPGRSARGFDSRAGFKVERRRKEMRFIKESNVRIYVKEISNGNKQVGRDFLFALDAHIEALVKRSVRVHNGGHKRLDAAVAEYAGAKS